MKRVLGMLVAATVTASGFASIAFAQHPQIAREDVLINRFQILQGPEGAPPMPPPGANFVFIASENFDGKEVMLHGVVKEPTRLPIFNMKSYVLKDDSGEITILTEADLPKTDEELSVKVKVANLAIINGEPLGTTVTEIQRR